MNFVQRLDDWFYPGCDRSTSHRVFSTRVRQYIGPNDLVLDLGAGRGALPELDWRPSCAKVCGVDVDRAVLSNPMLHEARLIEDGKIPYESGLFHAVISNFVLEHLADPPAVFAEVARVLRPDGLFIARTPNRWHYVALIAAATPQWFHGWVAERRQREARDTFPTYYRCNTIGAIQRHCRGAGLQLETLYCDEPRPEYLRILSPTYLLGICYERTVNAIPPFRRLRAMFTVVARRISN